MQKKSGLQILLQGLEKGNKFMIKFENVSFHYGGEHGTGEGVDNIDFEIKKGEFIVLCGRSGCGKTTLTRLINGLAPHFYQGELEGRVLVEDVCVNEVPLSVTSHYVGSVFQNPKSQFFNVDSTGELVFGCENQNLDREIIKERLEKTKNDMQIEALMNRNIFELSGGEKQQIAVGSAYTAAPDVYVLDEPSSNLDKKAIKRLRDILAKIKASGKTVVVSEHRIFYLLGLADRFIYMDDGRITGSYTAKEVADFSDEELKEKGLRLPDLTRLNNIGKVYNEQTDKSTAVDVIDLTCGRGGNQILDIDRFSVPKCSVVALIGDNGCGKSTLSEALCGLIPADGSIGFEGKYLNAKERVKKSFLVMQDVNRQLFSDSVMEEVRMQSDITEEETRKVLALLGIEELADRHPASLSGGQKQRVAIASAICAKKDILFYDEPTSGLDRGGMENFGRLLNETKEKTSVNIIVTHDPELILECCTHVLYMENGRIQSFYPLNEDGAKRLKTYFLSEGDINVSKKREKIGMFTKIFQYMGNYKKVTIASVFVLILAAMASIMPYFEVWKIIDATLSGKIVNLTTIGGSIILITAYKLVYTVLYIFGLQLSHHSAYHTLENLRCSLQEKLEKQPLGSIIDKGSGAIKKLFSEDVESVELLLAHMIPEGISNLIVFAVMFFALITVNWLLALVTLFMIFFGISASGQVMKIGMSRMGNYFAAAKRLNNAIIEYVNGMEAVRIFNRQDNHSEKYEGHVKNYHNYALDWYKVCFPWMAAYGSFFSQITLYSIPLGGILIVTGYLELSEYILALCISFGTMPLLLNCMRFIGALPQVNYKIQAIEKALDFPPLKEGKEKFNAKNHDISFNDIHFSYKNDEIIRGISLDIKTGETVAFVGESGSGKSTLAKLLVHYYDVSSGSIALGGQKLTDLSLEALNNEISFVSQNLFLFNKSILENIRVGKPAATDEEVKEAARKAECEDFILELEGGYEAMAGEAGNRLSGGQKQRIAFARAILKDAPVLVLDEATAFIDPENEKKMQKAVKELMKDKTVIAIAHKLRSVKDADKIVVLDKGRIADVGKHNELIDRCEIYGKLWKASEETERWSLIRKEGVAE